MTKHATCSYCNKPRILTKTGHIRHHDQPKRPGQKWATRCPGSRQPPKPQTPHA